MFCWAFCALLCHPGEKSSCKLLSNDISGHRAAGLVFFFSQFYWNGGLASVLGRISLYPLRVFPTARDVQSTCAVMQICYSKWAWGNRGTKPPNVWVWLHYRRGIFAYLAWNCSCCCFLWNYPCCSVLWTLLISIGSCTVDFFVSLWTSSIFAFFCAILLVSEYVILSTLPFTWNFSVLYLCELQFCRKSLVHSLASWA